MTLTNEDWKKILDIASRKNVDILERIKEKLNEQDEGTYQKWARENFDINHLFSVSLTIGNK